MHDVVAYGLSELVKNATFNTLLEMLLHEVQLYLDAKATLSILY